MLRNPAYAGRACFGKTMRTDQTAGLNRTARLTGRATHGTTQSSSVREDYCPSLGGRGTYFSRLRATVSSSTSSPVSTNPMRA